MNLIPVEHFPWLSLMSLGLGAESFQSWAVIILLQLQIRSFAVIIPSTSWILHTGLSGEKEEKRRTAPKVHGTHNFSMPSVRNNLQIYARLAGKATAKKLVSCLSKKKVGVFISNSDRIVSFKILWWLPSSTSCVGF